MNEGASKREDSKDGMLALSARIAAGAGVPRITSRDLLGAIREIEIDHEGRIYRLRLTQSNKLILTA